jgi:hypothetical protein
MTMCVRYLSDRDTPVVYKVEKTNEDLFWVQQINHLQLRQL